MWEYEKEGLTLEQVQILDYNSNTELFTIDKSQLPLIFKEPLQQFPYFTQDKIFYYYMSIQLPLVLDKPKPAKIFHRFILKNSKNENVVVEGGSFVPRFNESPIVIGSPVKGKNWIFMNQSSMGSHFKVLFFVNSKIMNSERFAFDNAQLNDSFNAYYQGDPKVNSSYFNYLDTLYAVSNGVITSITDGRPENHGNAQDVQFNNLDEMDGNYLEMDIGNGMYALYAHIHPNSFFVKVGDIVKEGDPLALIGNSGNSTSPHLHFQISDGTDFLSNGIPFVLKTYTKLGVTTQVFTNSMPEEFTVISF
ncbi:MAG: M23 family metallopeptidase [Bacteroidales bacterium]|nr:M23 family metallopeptidase [Bacteroidales bacterium]